MLRSLKHSRRLFTIAFILAREDALFILDDLNLSPVASTIAKCFARKHAGKRKGERLALALERLGPTFIKLGQAISTRSDLVGEEIAADMSGLRDDLPAFDSAKARAIIEAEFERPLSELFLEFDDEPIAAASIAQVHKAVTRNGKKVAVKVVRPGIEEAFSRDIELFFWIAELIAQRRPDLRRLKLREVVQTFKQTAFFEMDLRFEAAAADEMAKNIMRHEPGLRIPEVVWDLTSRNVHTAAWVQGISFNDMAAIRASGHSLDMMLEKAAKSLFAQVFMDGFFHADLHPGNLFLEPESGDLIAVDFGIMGRLDWQSRAYIARIIHGFLNEDYRAVAELHFAAGYVPAGKNLEQFVQACKAVARPIMGKPLNEISVAKLLGQMFAIAAEFEMEVQPQLLLMQKTLMVAEGFGRMLNPNLNMWELARPMIEQWAQENFSGKARAKMAAEEAKRIATQFPLMLRRIEKTLQALGDEQGLRLHPETVQQAQLARKAMHKQWLVFAWSVLAIATGVLVWVFG